MRATGLAQHASERHTREQRAKRRQDDRINADTQQHHCRQSARKRSLGTVVIIQAARTGSRSIKIAPATAVMLRRIGPTNHQMMFHLSQRGWNSTFASTAPAVRMAMAGYSGIT